MIEKNDLNFVRGVFELYFKKFHDFLGTGRQKQGNKNSPVIKRKFENSLGCVPKRTFHCRRVDLINFCLSFHIFLTPILVGREELYTQMGFLFMSFHRRDL